MKSLDSQKILEIITVYCTENNTIPVTAKRTGVSTTAVFNHLRKLKLLREHTPKMWEKMKDIKGGMPIDSFCAKHKVSKVRYYQIKKTYFPNLKQL